MEMTPDIELILDVEGEYQPESFSINPNSKFDKVWNKCKNRVPYLDSISIPSTGNMLFESDSNKTLKELDLETNTKLYIRFSKEESDLYNINGNAQLKKVEKSGEKRSLITKGINLRGRCPNVNCPDFKKMVVVQVGFQTCNVIEKLADSKCPTCQEFFEPDTFIYFDCKYQYSGVYIDRTLKTNSKIKVEPTKWKSTERKQVHSYAPDASRTKAWLELEIKAKPIDDLT